MSTLIAHGCEFNFRNFCCCADRLGVGGLQQHRPADRDPRSIRLRSSDRRFRKQQTLLNIVKLRYGDFPVFMEIGQVIAGYQLQTTVGAGISAQNYITSSVGGPVAVGGSAAAAATYIDRPTVIYAPLTGNDFIKKLMTPILPVAVLFLLQSGYSATLVMQIAVDSINGVANESRRAGMTRHGDPEFMRLAQLLYELQLANALQIRVERRRTILKSPSSGFADKSRT